MSRIQAQTLCIFTPFVFGTHILRRQLGRIHSQVVFLDDTPSHLQSLTAMATPNDESKPLVGVLALQGAFEEHQACLEAVGCRTVQVGNVLWLGG
jgi:hypothetical protein